MICDFPTQSLSGNDIYELCGDVFSAMAAQGKSCPRDDFFENRLIDENRNAVYRYLKTIMNKIKRAAANVQCGSLVIFYKPKKFISQKPSNIYS